MTNPAVRDASDPLDSLDATALAELVRRGETTPGELLDGTLRRVEERNPRINAVVRVLEAEARRAIAAGLPDGPFRGVPFLLKDLGAEVAGEPYSCGSRFLSGNVSRADSELVRRYRAAGFVFAGKTSTPEFGITPFTEPDLFGPVRNPWDLSRTSGGSSGGAAASVAARIVPAAHGGDGGGSIRIPASCCGVFGLKPTRGRTPCGPSVGEEWQGLVVDHVLTRSVRDSAAILDATSGPDPGAPCFPAPPVRPYLEEVARDPGRLRVAFTAKPFLGSSVEPECVAGLHDTVRLLEGLGHDVEEATPSFDGEEFALAFVKLLCGEVSSQVEGIAAEMGRRPKVRDLEPATWVLALLGRALTAEQFATAIRVLRLAGRRIGEFFERYDVLLTPTLSRPPVPVGSLQLSEGEKRLARFLARFDAGWLLMRAGILEPTAKKVFEFVPYTAPFNVTGQPAMSVPLYRTPGGLPVGMQFVGRYGDEATLFRLAGQLEQSRPWADLRPPL